METWMRPTSMEPCRGPCLWKQVRFSPWPWRGPEVAVRTMGWAWKRPWPAVGGGGGGSVVVVGAGAAGAVVAVVVVVVVVVVVGGTATPSSRWRRGRWAARVLSREA